MRNAELVELTIRKHKNTFEDMLNSNLQSQNDLAWSDNEEKRQDDYHH